MEPQKDHVLILTFAITTNMRDKSATVTTVKSCAQGGVLSSLLWSMVVDNLLHKLRSNSGFSVQCYADDLVVTVRDKCEAMISGIMQIA